MKNRRSLTGIIQLWGIILLTVIGVSVVGIDVISTYRDFNSRIAQMRAMYISRQKEMIQQEVKHVANIIDYEKTQSEELVKKKIRMRVNEAYAVAKNIYINNKADESPAEINKMIFDALRPVRFETGTGYYFAIRLDGLELLFADKPEVEGLNMMQVRDPRGQYVVKDMLEIARNSGEGFYEYHWTKPGTEGNDFKKISFVRMFEPLGFVIGAGLYVDDVERQLKSDLLSTISRIRYGSEGYIFVNRLNGDALVANGKVVAGKKKLWEVFDKNPEKTKEIFKQEYDAALKPEGDYIYYSIIKMSDSVSESPKVSFIYGIEEWQWLIGTGVYLDDVESVITILQEQLNRQVLAKGFKFAVFVVITMAFFLLLFSRVNRRLKNDFNLLISFLNKAAFSDETIDRDHVQFDELDRMAVSVNKMIHDKILIRQELLSEREQLFVTIRSIGDGVITTDTSGRIELMNRVAEQLTGIVIKDALGKSLDEIFKIADVDTMEAVDNPVEQVLNDGAIDDGENHTMLVSADGNQYHISHSAAPIKDGYGKTTGSVLVFRNISEEFRIRKIMMESEKNFRTLMEQSPIAMQIYNLDGLMINANNAFFELWDIKDKDEILGHYNLLKDPHFLRLGLIEQFSKAFAGEPVAINEIEFNPEAAGFQGRRRIVKIKAYPLMLSDNTFQHVVIFNEDITDQKYAEKEMLKIQKLESIGTLAGGIAHDFNNILMGAMGYLELSKLKLASNDDIAGYIEAAEAALHRARHLTTQLLTFARGGAPVLQAVNLQQVVTESVTFNLIGSNVKACLGFSGKLLPVKADKEQLYQVVACLTLNAREAMPDGGRLYIDAGNVKDLNIDSLQNLAGDYVKLVLHDEGVGIDEDILDRIFDPYFSTKEEGNGLGLATVHSIVTRHNGAIQVESVSGEGTTVTLFLPVNTFDERNVDIDSGRDPGQTDRAGAPRILIMDDEDLIQRVAMAMLEKSGFEVNVVSDGDEALAAYSEAKEENRPFDIVIMDLTIPGGMGGKEAVVKLLEIDPDASVIVSSGYYSDPVIADFRNYGFKGCLTKPFKMDELLEEVKKLLLVK